MAQLPQEQQYNQSQYTAQMPEQQAPARSPKFIIVLAVALALVLIIILLVAANFLFPSLFFKESAEPVTDRQQEIQSESDSQDLGDLIYTEISNPVQNKIPESQIPNALDDVYKNPFE